MLQRGLENDYVIDYNAAEITFNPSIYISKHSQLLIEFEYSDRQFGRTVMAVDHHQDIGKLEVRAGYFQENDNINNPITDLSESDMDQLAQAESDLGYGYIEAVDSVTYQASKVLYERADTLINNELISYYKYSQDPERAIYEVNFSFIGEGRGDYVMRNGNNNQTIYDYVAPVNGQHRGNYAPVRKIALPQQRKLFNLGATYHVNERNNLSFDFANSERTANRFNPEQTEKSGSALKLAYEGITEKLGKNEQLNFNYGLSLEHLDSAFSPIQNFRSLDFNREWGMSQSGQYLGGEERIVTAYGGLSLNQHLLKYEVAFRDKKGQDILNGNRQSLNYQHQGDISVKLRLYSMSSTFNEFDNEWNKAFADLSYSGWKITPGYVFEYQQHAQRASDSIVSSFQHYISHEAYIQKRDNASWDFRLSHQWRKDFRPFNGSFELFEESQTTQLAQKFSYQSTNSLKLNILRRTIIPKHELANNEDFYQGSFNWDSYYWQGNINQKVC
ncbi:MAG: hypothetical protein EX285_08780, partial [Thaumarchaeota archaeon]|nr:hypothetical protein [Nitrososphaerota archaeon]